MNRHWTLDELTDRLYGIGEAGAEREEHMESCRECRVRLEELDRLRAASAAAPELSPARLAAQRSAVLAQIDTSSRRLLRWVPALTAACLVAIGVYVYRPSPAVPRKTEPAAVGAPAVSAAANDAQLFADIYNVEESDEPRAAAPMHALFQEGQQ